MNVCNTAEVHTWKCLGWYISCMFLPQLEIFKKQPGNRWGSYSLKWGFGSFLPSSPRRLAGPRAPDG